MAGFVLVHGGFSGAWVWLPLMDDLPGMGHDNTSASEVSLDNYASRVCEVLAASSEPGIVVGRSMGGIVARSGTLAFSYCGSIRQIGEMAFIFVALPLIWE